MELATFETSDEVTELLKNSFLIEIFDRIQDKQYKHFHVDGITSAGNSHTEWYWTNSGEKIPYYLPWATGEPNFKDQNEFCLSIGKGSKNHRLGFNDIGCWNSLNHFICQKTELKN